MKHLLLQGPRGCRKSSTILEELCVIAEEIGGFGTSRLLAEDGSILGFRQRPAKEMLRELAKKQGNFDCVNEHYRPGLPGTFMTHQPKRGTVHLPVLMEETLPLLRPEQGVKALFLDEIGGVELTIPEWRDQLKACFTGDIPCIGVWKCRANTSHGRKKTEVLSETAVQYEAFYDFLTQEEQVEIYTVDPERVEEARNKVRNWMKENHLPAE